MFQLVRKHSTPAPATRDQERYVPHQPPGIGESVRSHVSGRPGIDPREMTSKARSMHAPKKFLIGAVIASTAVLAGCGSSNGGGDGEHGGSDDHVHIDPYDPAHLDEVGTATTAMQVILSWQPGVDESKSDALRRARPWLAGNLLDTVDNDGGGVTGVRPDRDWVAWKESGDALTASCSKAESTPAAPEGMRTVVIDVSCRQTVLHAAGSSTNLAGQTWRTTVTRTENGWRLTDFRYQ